MRVFISHSSADKKFVRTLKDDLTENGIQTWVDEDELEFGDSLIAKLEIAVEQSTHFVIILSPNSVESDWVKLELSKAKLLKDNAILKKIVPIKYRHCTVPNELIDLIYGDLSDEIVVRADNNKIKFTTNGYEAVFNKLIRTLRSNEKTLTTDDKVKMRETTDDISRKEEISRVEPSMSEKPKICSFYLRVVKYRSKGVLSSYAEMVRNRTSLKEVKALLPSNIHPIILPSTLKLYDSKYAVGEEILIQNKHLYQFRVHFGGYKTLAETYTIALPGIARQNLRLEEGKIYLFEFNVEKNVINIV